MYRLTCHVLLLCLWLSISASASDRKPNVVIFLADDLGYGELGCYGQNWIKTPNIDRLASEGLRFTDFYAGNAVCAPSRCCLMTGKHPGQAYVRGNGDPRDLQFLAERNGWEFPGQNPIPDSEVTMAEILKRQGYATAAIGKWGLGHFGTSGDPNQQGFDLFYGFNCQRHAHNHYPKFLWRNNVKEILPGNDRTLNGATYSQDRFTDVAIEFIRDNAESPFLLYMPFAIPHLSIQVPQDSLNQYEGKIPEADYEHRGYLKHPSPRAGYAAMVSHLDRDIGRIMEELQKQGLDENTLVLFTSDNGPTFERLGGADSDFFNSSSGLRGRKGSLYEGGIRVPLIARWSGKISENTTTNHAAAFWDLLPTICEVLDTEPPPSANGVSFFNELRGLENEKSTLYWEFPSYGGQQAIRDGKWKAVRQGMSKKTKLEQVRTELYDLSSDPNEETDLAAQFPDVLGRLSLQMQAMRTPSVQFPFPVLDAIGRSSVRPGINKNFVARDLEIPEWMARFEVESREVYSNRNEIVEKIGVKPGQVVADIGAGTGLYTFLFAQAAGPQGHVQAVDISPKFLKHIEDKAQELSVPNITTTKCRPDSTMLSADSIDVAFVCDTYHHFEFPKRTLASLYNALRPGGQLVVIDFHRIPGESRDWILNHVRAGKETVKSEIEAAGFRLMGEDEVAGLTENYFMRFRRP